MLVDKTVSFRAAHDKARMQDQPLLSQRAKVRLVGDEGLAAFLPVRIAGVEGVFHDGTRLAERVEAVRGTVRNPMSRGVSDKARDLAAPVLGPPVAERLIDCVYALEEIPDIRQLTALLRRP